MKPYFETDKGKLYEGHILKVLKQMESESIHCVVTSPPYWGLRDYGLDPVVWDDPGDCDHVWSDSGKLGGGGHKHGKSSQQNGSKQIEQHENISESSTGQFCQKCGAWRGCLGLEPTPQLFIKHQVDIFREVRRVLRKDGTCWVNIGDSYISNPKSDFGDPKYRGGRDKIDNPNRKKIPGLKSKDLGLIPERLIIALQENGWFIRSKIPWIKRNCMPESCKDRPTTAIEYFFLLSKSRKYFYDHEAVKLPASLDTHARYARGRSNSHKYADGGPGNQTISKSFDHIRKPVGWQSGPGSHDSIPKGRYQGTGVGWGRQSELDPNDNRQDRGRIKEPGVTPKSQPAGSGIKANDSFQAALKDIVDTRARRNSDWFFDSFQGLFSDEEGNPLALVVNSTGFSGAHYATYPPKLIEPCILAGCPRGGTVLDPFAGSGTTCFVSEKLGRKWIGIDMDCSIGKERIEEETKQRRLF